MFSPYLFQLYDLFAAGHPVTTDSRKVPSGAIFFALQGENFDGNRYAAGALDAGAVCAVVDDPKIAVDKRYCVVPNVLEILQVLARHHRRQLAIPVLAITGSNGKTTTKELVHRVLSRRFRVFSTQGNLNNHIGIPLTLLSMKPDTEFAVVEMGANHQGEIASYCAVAEPDYGLITNVGKAHLEGFGGAQGIRKGKGELFDYLAQNQGTAFYPEESDTLYEMAKERSGLTAYGFSAGALEVLSSEEDTLLNLRYDNRVIHTNLIGEYNRHNVAAALAIGEYFEVEPSAVVEAVESYVPDNNRSQRIKTGSNILYMDAYNANPSSMAVALDNFAKISEPGYQKVLILGDMRELGEYTEEEHRAVIQAVRKMDIAGVYLVGTVFQNVNQEKGFRTFTDSGTLSAYLKQYPLKQSVILIKGSRGMQLESLMPALSEF